jgi:hypothetical protein
MLVGCVMRIERRLNPPPQARAGEPKAHTLPGYTDVVVVEASDRALHSAWHLLPCWCDGLDDDAFFAQLYDRCLQAAGFSCIDGESKGRVLIRAVDLGHVGELERVMRACI